MYTSPHSTPPLLPFSTPHLPLSLIPPSTREHGTHLTLMALRDQRSLSFSHSLTRTHTHDLCLQSLNLFNSLSYKPTQTQTHTHTHTRTHARTHSSYFNASEGEALSSTAGGSLAVTEARRTHTLTHASTTHIHSHIHSLTHTHTHRHFKHKNCMNIRLHNFLENIGNMPFTNTHTLIHKLEYYGFNRIAAAWEPVWSPQFYYQCVQSVISLCAVLWLRTELRPA